MRNTFLICLLLICFGLGAQQSVNIALLNDYRPDNELERNYQQRVKDEILQLLQHRHNITFNELYPMENPQNFEADLTKAYSESDIVVGVGIGVCNAIINNQNFSKPTIASIVVNPELQGLKMTSEGTSGVNNFTYLNSPFNLRRDLKTLYDVYPYEQLLVVRQAETLINGGEESSKEFLKILLMNDLPDANVSIRIVDFGEDLSTQLSDAKDKKIATYVFPYLGQDTMAVPSLFQQLRTANVPSAAMFGGPYVKAGALVGYDVNNSLQKVPRRIALDIMKLLEGKNASELPAQIEMAKGNLLFNMETARQIGIYPSFDLVSESDATLVNLDKEETDNVLTLNQAIAVAMKNNLDIKIQESQVGIQKKQADLAMSELLPQADVSTALNIVDDITALSYQGVQGQVNWLASGNVTQIIYAEPLLANLAIQKMLTQVQDASLRQQQYDVVIDVATAYMNVLYAQNNLNIQEENVARNRENYSISENKETIGYVGASDLNRWRAEVANANINLNDAYATYRQAKFRLNQLLNRPVNEPVQIENIQVSESATLVTDPRIGAVNNYGNYQKFANFMVDFAQTHLPELEQINLNMAIQERTLLSNERALFLPSIQANGGVNRLIQKWQVPETFSMTDFDNTTTWNIGLGASLPIFQGNKRKYQIEQTKLNLLQVQDTRQNVQNQLELQIRSNIENVGASYSQMELSRIAADASRKNFEIVQDAYSAGQTTIVTLIDAQNNALQTELAAVNAVFTFILDILNLERSAGFFYFLATEQERAAFFDQANSYILSGE